jgi:hypothetical protein
MKGFSNAQFDQGKDFLKDWWTRRVNYLRTQVDTGTNNAAFVSQNVPGSMSVGQTVSVTVRMKNTGTTTWTNPGYALGSQNPVDNSTWGMNRVQVPAGVSVAPNAEYSFTWNVTAPAAAGTYNFQWRMRQSGVEWFGATPPNVAVNVTAAAPAPPPPSPTPTPPPPPATPEYDADFVSQTVPGTLVAGGTYTATVVMRNTGTDTWRPGDDDRLGSLNPESNTTWGAARINLPAGAAIATGQEATFTWTFTAPTTPGTYNFQWQMRQSLIDLWFGDKTPNLAIVVETEPTTPPPPTPGGTNGADFISQTVQTAMVEGQTYPVTLIFENNGTTTWTHAAGYRLSSRGPRDNTTWGLNRVSMPAGSSIAPGQRVTFTFDVTAPAAGTHVFQWSLIQEGVDWFNEVSTAVNVVVSAAPAGGGGGGAGGPQGDLRDGVDEKCWGSIGTALPWGAPLAGALAAFLLSALGRRRSAP